MILAFGPFFGICFFCVVLQIISINMSSSSMVQHFLLHELLLIFFLEFLVLIFVVFIVVIIIVFVCAFHCIIGLKIVCLHLNTIAQ